MKFSGFAGAKANGDRALALYINSVKLALTSTVQKLRGEIQAIHAKGNFPPDYSLGFANGMIFAEHKVCGYTGEAKFYNRTTSVGKLPKPIALDPADFDLMFKKKSAADETYLELLEVVCAEAIKLDEGAPLALRDAAQAVQAFLKNFEEIGEVEAPKVEEPQANV